MSELKPCPFCGKEQSEKNFFSCDGYPQACGCWETTHTGEEACEVWNTRPIEDALRAEIARLKEENHALDQINRDIQTAAAHLDEVSAELAETRACLLERNIELKAAKSMVDQLWQEHSSRDEIIIRLKEDGERLASVDQFQEICPFCDNCDGYGYRKPEDVPDGEEYTGEYPEHSSDCPITLHRALMKELE
jgi:hypothetical protein